MKTALVWFRQDLRINDNPALYEACQHHDCVLPVYILDETNDVLGDAQKWWLHHSLQALKVSLKHSLGLSIVLKSGNPLTILNELSHQLNIHSVYWNRCYEPKQIARDKKIKTELQNKDIKVHSFNGNLFNEPWTISNSNGHFFKVFTPYWKCCRQKLISPSTKTISHQPASMDIAGETLESWALLPKKNWADRFPTYWTPGEQGALDKLHRFINDHLDDYKINRDFPDMNATSRLSPHLHFGEISPWTILRTIEDTQRHAHVAFAGAEHFLSELGWREFSYHLLYHFPQLPEENFKPAFNQFPWRNDMNKLQQWQQGKTGYPIIDAGMRELWTTGYMHNRVRMLVASFLTKDLFIDWRLGANWFLNTLLDADLANNSASWQWVAGSGADAAPYFRIFNPIIQSQKFDPTGAYIRRWLPELSEIPNTMIHAPWQSPIAQLIYKENKYPKPIVDHSEARLKALSYYKQLDFK